MNANVITLIVYFLIIILIGVKAYASTKTQADYVLGGRTFGSIVTALGAGASDMSSWLMLALPGTVYMIGFKAVWLPIGLIIGAFLNWHFVAKKLRIETEKANNALTIPAFIGNRFDDAHHSLRLITSLVILLFFTFYSAAGFVAGGTLFTHLFGLEYHKALLVSAPVIVFYTSIGGFLAVNWVDVFQGLLMLVALIVLPVVTIMTLGGYHGFHVELLAHSQHVHGYMDLMATSWLKKLSWLSWGLGYFGQPHILVRFMAAERPEAIRNAKIICMVWMTLALFAAVSVGLVGRAYYAETLVVPEKVFLLLSGQLFNPWIAGILYAAVLSCIMSAISAQLLLCSSAVVEDGYRQFIKPNATQRELVHLGRLVVFVVAAIALCIAYNPNERIMTLVSHAWAGLGASFSPVILGILYYKKMHYRGAVYGMTMGASGIVLWLYLQSIFGTHGFWGMYEIIPGFLLGMMGVWLGSRSSESRR